MRFSNTLFMLVMITANVFSFYWGEYNTLSPTLYITGLALISIAYWWASFKIKTRDFIILTSISCILAFFDEYSHTLADAFTYFDGMQPSPLSVFGWGVFIPVILTLTQALHKKIDHENFSSRIPKTTPVVISIILLIMCSWMQGYLSILLKVPLIVVYIFLGLTSLYYSSQHSSDWNVLVIIISLVTSALMEVIGIMDGMWTYHYNELFPIFIFFTWTLRTLTILGVSSLFNIEFN